MPSQRLHFLFTILFIISLLCSYAHAAAHLRPRSAAQCHPLHTTFPASSVAHSSSYSDSPAQFVAISSRGSYQTGSGGLELYLEKPAGVVTTKNSVNDKTSDGATVNSTFTLLYGKVTFKVSAPVVSGVVTAVILIADEHDEIDVELLGGDPAHWQTNVFAPSSGDSRPLYGVFSSKENVPATKSWAGSSNADFHSYAIDWDADRIIWSVDGDLVRTLTREQTWKDGILHYPSHPARIQMGIWDASNPAGTSDWARGPIDWEKAPEKVTAVVRSVTIECPGS